MFDGVMWLVGFACGAAFVTYLQTQWAKYQYWINFFHGAYSAVVSQERRLHLLAEKRLRQNDPENAARYRWLASDLATARHDIRRQAMEHKEKFKLGWYREDFPHYPEE